MNNQIDTPIQDKSYTRRMERLLTRRYMGIVATQDPDSFALIAQRKDIQQGENKTTRMKEYVALWQGLSADQQLKLAEHDAKINHLARLARTLATTTVVQAHNKIKTTTAGSIDFVMRRFREEGVAPEQVQQFLDDNAVAWFSITGHPTNPTTVDYTIAQTDVARVIVDPSATPDDLHDALLHLYHTPIVGDRKTPLDEARESINALNSIYDSALAHRDLFIKAIADHGYAAQGVNITRALIVPCSWTLGDADGNPALTAQVLADGIALHRQAIADRYQLTLQSIHTDHAPTIQGLRELQKTLAQAGPQTQIDSVCQKIQSIIADCPDEAAQKQIQDFRYLLHCFGFGFGTIDIRHNAVDILAAVKKLAVLCGLENKQDMDAIGLDHIQLKLAAWLRDNAVLSRMASTTDLPDDESAMIVGRLRVIGKNPDMCEKLIIAETTHPAHALAALLLLKITGNVVADDGARIDLTMLSESVHDLMNLGNTLETLLDNETFRAHVAARGRLLVMIAKSDTTRQDGRGEAEYAQYEAAIDIYRVAEKMRRKYRGLRHVLPSIMNGGGHALQRGGGRVTEIPAVHGRAAADARATDIGPSTLTVQGHQQNVLFCPGPVAVGTMEALAAQNLYSKAGIYGEMPDPVSRPGLNRHHGQYDAWLYAQTAGRAFDTLTQKNVAIDELLVRAPWLAMKAGNASSRPAKRGEKMVGPGITPREAIGVDPRALQGRAISGERLTAHACLPIFSVLGLVEAMISVRDHGRASRNPEKYGDGLHHLYRAHKIHRDGARATLNASIMADFDIAWPLLVGDERPPRTIVEKLAAQFLHHDPDHNNTPAITLAFLEQYFLNVERLSYEMVSGQKAKKNFNHGDGLRILWPELFHEMSVRNRAAEFSRVIECYRTVQMDRAPDIPLDETQFRITQNLYAAADVVNAPIGILATRTRLEPVYDLRGGVKTRFMKPESYLESDVAGLLSLPPALS